MVPSTAANESVSYEPQIYTFETKTHLFRIPVNSDAGTAFEAIKNGADKVKYLKGHGEETKKAGEGRIMIPQKGAFLFFNVGQLEYMVNAETELGRRYERVKDGFTPDQKKEFLLGNATRIREWPDEIKRVQSE